MAAYMYVNMSCYCAVHGGQNIVHPILLIPFLSEKYKLCVQEIVYCNIGSCHFMRYWVNDI